MLVDKSHSKKDIVSLFKKHGVIIDAKLSKGNIVKDIESYMIEFKYNDKIKKSNRVEGLLEEEIT